MEAVPKKNFLYDAVLPKVELLNWLVACLGLVLRLFFLLPGGDNLLMVGLGGLAIVYFLRAFAPLPFEEGIDEAAFDSSSAVSETGDDRITVLARYLQAFGSMLALSGILFKFLFWHGSAFMLPAGTAALLFAIAWQSSIGTLRRQTILIAGLGAFAWSIPTEALLRQLYSDDPTLVEKMLYLDQHPHDRVATQAMHQALVAWHKRKH